MEQSCTPAHLEKTKHLILTVKPVVGWWFESVLQPQDPSTFKSSVYQSILKYGKWTDSYIFLFYSPRALKALYTTYLIHPFTQAPILYRRAFYLTFAHMYVCQVFGMQTGAASQRVQGYLALANNLPISRRPALPPVLQLPRTDKASTKLDQVTG